MAEINLLTVPVILPPASRTNNASTSLVLVSRLPAANQIIHRGDTAYPDDNFVWSVAASDNGSFQFYAVPLKSFLSGGASSQGNGLLSAQGFAPNWNAPSTSNAAAQYQLLASMSMPMYGHTINVYA